MIDGLEWIGIGIGWSDDDGGERREAMHRERLGVVNMSCNFCGLKFDRILRAVARIFKQVSSDQGTKFLFSQDSTPGIA